GAGDVAGVRGGAGPQEHRGVHRVAGGDAVLEDLVSFGGGGGHVLRFGLGDGAVDERGSAHDGGGGGAGAQHRTPGGAERAGVNGGSHEEHDTLCPGVAPTESL